MSGLADESCAGEISDEGRALGESQPSATGVELAPGVHVPAGGFRMQFARSSGPGGQNVNKLNTRSEIWVRVDQITGLSFGALDRLKKSAGRRLTIAGEIHLIGDIGRTQESNRRAVMDRLREMILAAAVEPRPRRKTRRTAGSNRRRLQSKRQRSEIKSGRRHLED